MSSRNPQDIINAFIWKKLDGIHGMVTSQALEMYVITNHSLPS